MFWNKLNTSIKAPKLDVCKETKKGKLIVKTKDLLKFKTLRQLITTGSGFREAKFRNPMIIIKYVSPFYDADFTKMALIDKNKNKIRILQMTSVIVNWVADTTPETYKKLEGNYVYIGLHRCIVQRYDNVL